MSDKDPDNPANSAPLPNPPPRITPREREILALIAEGLTDQEIADRLWVSRGTVHTHLVHLREKLRVRNRVALVREAERRGLLPAQKSTVLWIGDETYLGYTPGQDVVPQPFPELAGGDAPADTPGETEMLNPRLRFWYLAALLALGAENGAALARPSESGRAPARSATVDAPGKANGIEIRRVGAGDGGNARGTPSADGRYLSMVDWATGDLAIRDLTSGKSRRLTDKGPWSKSGEFAWDSALSPNGKQVAYAWFVRNGVCDLRLVGMNGSRPRVLYRDEKIGWMTALQWSADGKQILAYFYPNDGGSQIALVSVADGSARVLKSFRRDQPGEMRISPDGRAVAYDYPPQTGVPERDIFLLATDGSGESPLVQHPADDSVLGWTPDGTRLLFASDRTGGAGAWLVRVEDGKPQGAPELVKQDLGAIVPLGLTRDGSLYYLLQVGIRDVYTATLDPATGQIQAPPRPVNPRLVGAKSCPAWSPDGRALAYVSRWGSTPYTGSCIVAIRSMESGETRELLLRLEEIVQMEWAADGRSLRATGTGHQGRSGGFRIDAQTGAFTAYPDPAGFLRGVAWGLDGKSVFYPRGDANTRSRAITVRDLETGQERELHRGSYESNPRLALSPDGRQLAFWWQDRGTRAGALKVVPAEGGEPRELLRDKENGLPPVTTLAWTPDGRHLLFARGGALWRIPVAGGPPHRLDLAMEGMRHLSVHPDGQRIAFTAGSRRQEVWVMENFLPPARR